jgi:ribosome maturation factor RimP
VALSRCFESQFDREKEDYSLTVTSAGLDQPFKVLKQYLKAVGTKVEVQLKGGRKMVALLAAADEEGVTLKYSVKEAVEGKKKKELVEHVDRYTMDQVNAVRPFIEFN